MDRLFNVQSQDIQALNSWGNKMHYPKPVLLLTRDLDCLQDKTFSVGVQITGLGSTQCKQEFLMQENNTSEELIRRLAITMEST